MAKRGMRQQSDVEGGRNSCGSSSKSENSAGMKKENKARISA